MCLMLENYGLCCVMIILSDGYLMLFVNVVFVCVMYEFVCEEIEKFNVAFVVVDNRRFRGNVVVDDVKVYVEDMWFVIVFGVCEV